MRKFVSTVIVWFGLMAVLLGISFLLGDVVKKKLNSSKNAESPVCVTALVTPSPSTVSNDRVTTSFLALGQDVKAYLASSDIDGDEAGFVEDVMFSILDSELMGKDGDSNATLLSQQAPVCLKAYIKNPTPALREDLLAYRQVIDNARAQYFYRLWGVEPRS